MQQASGQEESERVALLVSIWNATTSGEPKTTTPPQPHLHLQAPVVLCSTVSLPANRCYTRTATHYALLNRHHKPYTAHYALHTTHLSPLTTHCSPLTTHHLTTHCSLFTIRSQASWIQGLRTRQVATEARMQTTRRGNARGARVACRTRRLVSSTTQYLRTTTHHSLLTTHHYLLSTNHLPSATHYLLLTTHR